MIHVAVGVIHEPDGRILISRRAANAHQGDLWEFPGGKVEAGESVTGALKRELREELGIEIGPTRHLCDIRHDYGDRQVHLDVWEIDGYCGEALGLEGQALKRVPPQELRADEFPVANRPILRRLLLGDRMAITDAQIPEPVGTIRELADRHSGLIQLRMPQHDKNEWEHFLAELFRDPVLNGLRHRLLLNGPIELARRWQLGGCHLNSRRLHKLSSRADVGEGLLGASCHSLEDLQQAQELGADYAFLSPVRATGSHPDSEPLGWDAFARLCWQVRIPVYALGGMRMEDLETARARGAQGIAGISLFRRPAEQTRQEAQLR